MQFSYVFGPTGQPTLALWILSMVYGMFVVLFGTAVHLLRKSISSRSGDSTVEKSLLYVAVISFLLTTTAIGVCFVLVAYTYGVNMSRLEDMVVRAANPSQTYHKFMTASEQLQIITAVLLNLQIMVADAFLLWRCYVVWNKKAIVVKIVLPMVVVETVMGFVRLGWSAAPANFLEEGTLSPIEFYISMVYFASLLAINLTMSMLIAFRTFRAHRAMRHFPGLSLGRRYLWLTYLIVECGASYWLCIIIVIGVELGSSKVYSSLGEDLSSLSTPFVMIFLQIAATLGAAIFPTLLIVFIEVGRTTEHLVASVAARPLEMVSSAMPHILIEQSTETVVDFGTMQALPPHGNLSSGKDWAMESESRVGGRNCQEAV